MKKIVSIFLVFSILFAFAACGNSEPKSPKSDTRRSERVKTDDNTGLSAEITENNTKEEKGESKYNMFNHITVNGNDIPLPTPYKDFLEICEYKALHEEDESKILKSGEDVSFTCVDATDQNRVGMMVFVINETPNDLPVNECNIFGVMISMGSASQRKHTAPDIAVAGYRLRDSATIEKISEQFGEPHHIEDYSNYEDNFIRKTMLYFEDYDKYYLQNRVEIMIDPVEETVAEIVVSYKNHSFENTDSKKQSIKDVTLNGKNITFPTDLSEFYFDDIRPEKDIESLLNMFDTFGIAYTGLISEDESVRIRGSLGLSERGFHNLIVDDVQCIALDDGYDGDLIQFDFGSFETGDVVTINELKAVYGEPRSVKEISDSIYVLFLEQDDDAENKCSTLEFRIFAHSGKIEQITLHTGLNVGSVMFFDEVF